MATDRISEEDFPLGAEATIRRFNACPKNSQFWQINLMVFLGLKRALNRLQIERRKNFWSKVKPSHFGVNIGLKSFTSIFVLIIVGMIIGLFNSIAFGRWLPLKFPSVFSLGFFKKSCPSEDEVKCAAFKMWFVGHGFSESGLVWQGNMKPDMEVVTRVTGPELAYLTTPKILVQCALIVLSQQNNLPKGGVLPLEIVFGPEDLQGNGI